MAQIGIPHSFNDILRGFENFLSACLMEKYIFSSVEQQNYFKNVVLPVLKSRFLESDKKVYRKIKDIFKIIVDSFQEEGITIIVNEVIPSIIECFKTADLKNLHEYIDYLIEWLDYLNDETIVFELLRVNSIGSEVNLRIFACRIMHMIHDSSKITNIFHSLSLDRTVDVRAECIRCVSRICIPVSVTKYVVVNALSDKSDIVRQMAASVFAIVAPDDINGFNELLNTPIINRAATAGIARMCQIHGTECFSQSIQQIITEYPNDSTLILIDIAKLHRPQDHSFLLECAQMLIKSCNFVWHIHEFSKYFQDKAPFLALLNPSKARQWRLRYALASQCVLFVQVFGSKLLPYCMRFSGDLVAIIREKAVELWVELVKYDHSIMSNLLSLMNRGWHARLIVAKALPEIGITDDIKDVALKLGHDSVSNVRYALAMKIKGSPLFNLVFNEINDIDISDLKKCE